MKMRSISFVLVLVSMVVIAVSAGTITFELTGIPVTWEGFPAGMVQPRDSPTHVEPQEFNGIAFNFTTSIITDQTTSSYGKMTVPLSKFEGYELDVYVSHANGLWPCVDSKGNGIQNLELSTYQSDASYIVQAEYVPNTMNEYFFNSTLLVLDN